MTNPHPGPVEFVAARDRIAVGVDFSSCSDTALTAAAALALRTGVELIPVHVCETAPLSFYPPLNPSYQTILRERIGQAREALDERCSRLPGDLTTAPLVVAGRPHESLGSAAKQHGAALLVVGTHGRTGLRRLFMGSVAERTVRASPIDVLVARGTPRAYRRILVPTDFSPRAERALTLAVRLVAPEGTIEVLHCCPASPVPSAAGMPVLSAAALLEPTLDEATAAGEHLIAQYEGACRAVAFSCLAEAPITGIRTRLDTGEFDLVVMGGSNHTGVERLLVGSVAEATVRHAPCSVLVVKDAAEAENVANPELFSAVNTASSSQTERRRSQDDGTPSSRRGRTDERAGDRADDRAGDGDGDEERVDLPERRRRQRREDWIDHVLDESFPASDPPAWTCGRQRRRQPGESDE